MDDAGGFAAISRWQACEALAATGAESLTSWITEASRQEWQAPCIEDRRDGECQCWDRLGYGTISFDPR